MPYLILLSGIVILICLYLNRISNKLGMPMLLAFILLGMLFGTDGIFKIQFDNYKIAEHICTISLIFIIFYGGFGTNWNSAKPVAIKAVLLSSVGVIITALSTGLFCFYVLNFGFLESMLIGATISSTDAASVFSIFRSKQLNLKYNTASMLEVESGSNDPCAYMLTVLILSLISGSVNGTKISYLIFSQIVYGIFIGVIIALISSYVLSKIKFSSDGFGAIFVFSIALLAYSVPTIIEGNGYLSTYITGVILGNKEINNKKSLVHFFDGLTGLMQMLIFFLLGLLSFPSQLPKIILTSLGISVFLTFVARPLAVFLVLTPFKCKLNQQLLVAWSGLRGAASIVFAIIATVSPAYTKNDVFHIVFFIVLFSISIQGSLIVFIAKKLNMIDNETNVMKTFSDYSDEVPVQFVKVIISDNHLWAYKKIQDIELLPDLLLTLIIRGDKRIIPKGKTIIFPKDIIVLSALSLDENLKIMLTKIKIDKDNDWVGKRLREIKLGKEKLVINLIRKNKVIIPKGTTKIKINDVVVISEV